MFSNLKIATRLGFGFGAVLSMMLGVGIFALVQMARVNGASTELNGNWRPSLKVLKEIDARISHYRVIELQQAIAGSPAEMQAADSAMAQVMASIQADRAAYARLVSSPQQQALDDEFGRQLQAYTAVHERVRPLSRDLKRKEAMALLNGESETLFKACSATLGQLMALNEQGGADAHAASERLYAQARDGIATLIALAAVLGVTVGVFVVRAEAGRSPRSAH